MYARLFSLVSPEHGDDIYCWGIEIAHRDEVEAVIYRKCPETRRTTHGVHESAEAARALYSRMLRRLVPNGLVLVWEDGEDELTALPDPEPEPALT